MLMATSFFLGLYFTDSEIMRASRYPFSLYASIRLPRSFLYSFSMYFDGLKIRIGFNGLLCLVFFIALRSLALVSCVFRLKFLLESVLFFLCPLLLTKSDV